MRRLEVRLLWRKPHRASHDRLGPTRSEISSTLTPALTTTMSQRTSTRQLQRTVAFGPTRRILRRPMLLFDSGSSDWDGDVQVGRC
jgi:hypothetical protein